MSVAQLLKTIPTLLAVSLLGASCIKGPGVFKKDDSSATSNPIGSATSSDGVDSGVFNPASQGSQLLEVSAGSPIEGAALGLPSGALSIPTTVSIQQGGSLTGGSLSSFLAAGTTLSSGGPAVVISANPSANASTPMTLRLPIAVTSLTLSEGETFYTVIYKVVDAQTGEYFSGLLTEKDFERDEKNIVIQTKRFGSFQVALSNKEIEEATEIPVNTPIATANDLAAHDEVSFSAASPIFAEGTRLVSWNVAVTGFSKLVYCAASYHSDKTADPLSVQTLSGSEVSDSTALSFGFTETTNAAVSVYAKFSCEDDRGYAAESEWTSVYNIIKLNLSPAIAAIADLTVAENSALSVINVNDDGDDLDVDGDALTYSCIYDQSADNSVSTSASLCSSLTGFTFSTTTGVIGWTPSYSQAGVYEIMVVATDGKLSDSEIFKITVTNSNRLPIIDTMSAALTVAENAAITFNVDDLGDNTDIDGELLTFSCFFDTSVGGGVASTNACNTGALSTATFTPSTGVFTWTPGYDKANVYELRVVAADSSGGTAEFVFTLTVTDVNRAPELASVTNETVPEDTAITTVNAMEKLGDSATDDLDLDNEDVDYSCYYDNIVDGTVAETTNLCTNLTGLSFDGDLGVMTWTPNFTQAALYQFMIKGIDDNAVPLSHSVLFTINVTNTNRAPVLDAISPAASYFEGMDEVSIDAGENADDYDADGDDIDYTCELTADVSGHFSGDPCSVLGVNFVDETGVFTWTPGFDTDDNTFAIRITGSDGTLTDYKDFSIDVDDLKIRVSQIQFDSDTPLDNDSSSDVPDRVFTEAGMNRIRLTGFCDDLHGYTFNLSGDIDQESAVTCSSGVFTIDVNTPAGVTAVPEVTSFFGRKRLTVEAKSGASVVDSDDADVYFAADGTTGANLIEISDESTLISVLHSANVDNSLYFYYLSSNITLVSPWSPSKDSGDASCTSGFSGVFEGNGFEIINMTMTDVNTDDQGFFCALDTTAVVSNLKLTNVALSESVVHNRIGAVAGRMQGGAVLINAEVTGSVSASDGYSVGGLVGEMQSGTSRIINSHASMNVSGLNQVGGIVGKGENTAGGQPANYLVAGTVFEGNVTGLTAGDDVGGIIGYLGEGKIYASKSISGIVTGTDHSNVGGIVGSINASSAAVQQCFTDMTVIQSGTALSPTGGIAGMVYRGKIKNSVSTSAITAKGKVGGIVGLVSDALGFAIQNSSFRGSITNTAGDYVGEFIGYGTGNFDLNAVTDSFSTGTVSMGGMSYQGGIAGYFGTATCTSNNDCVVNSFWNAHSTCRPSDNTGCTASAQETTASNYHGASGSHTYAVFTRSSFEWDMAMIWLPINGGFPTLRNLP